MSLTNPTDVVTEERLKDFYDEIFPYLGGKADAGFTPIGTIIPMIAETAPANYLICDGTAYNKSDYPELAAHLLSMTNHSMYEVSGDDTKFKVPDLRGEFLRGTGTNSHADNGNGANVGVHQDGTQIPNNWTTGATGYMRKYADGTRCDVTQKDAVINASDTPKNLQLTSSASDAGGNDMKYTVRPTNTSVLYCIAVKNIYYDANRDDFYTKSEVDADLALKQDVLPSSNYIFVGFTTTTIPKTTAAHCKALLSNNVLYNALNTYIQSLADNEMIIPERIRVGGASNLYGVSRDSNFKKGDTPWGASFARIYSSTTNIAVANLDFSDGAANYQIGSITNSSASFTNKNNDTTAFTGDTVIYFEKYKRV